MTYRVAWRSDAPLDLAASTARYTRWGPDPVNVVADGAYHRVAAGGVPYRAEQAADGSIRLTVPNRGDAAAACADLRHRLAEDMPRDAVVTLAATDPIVADLLARRPGYRPPLVADPFEAVVTAITAQQVNLAWATTTRARIVRAWGRRMDWDGPELWAFPIAAVLAGADVAALRGLQLTWRKAEYIVGAAAAARRGWLDGLSDLDDDAVIARLTAQRGIGRWTADWLLARHLGRPSAVAAGDLGVRKAVGTLYLDLGRAASEQETRAAASHWGDAANWLTHLLLEALNDQVSAE